MKHVGFDEWAPFKKWFANESFAQLVNMQVKTGKLKWKGGFNVGWDGPWYAAAQPRPTSTWIITHDAHSRSDTATLAAKSQPTQTQC